MQTLHFYFKKVPEEQIFNGRGRVGGLVMRIFIVGLWDEMGGGLIGGVLYGECGGVCVTAFSFFLA